MEYQLTQQKNEEKMSDPNTEDSFKILVATDIHLGYKEKEGIRGDDSFITFEEILSHARVNEVDFILLGGDLFHDTHPSLNALERCLTLLRDYTLGDKPFEIEILSDQLVNFRGTSNGMVNCENPNMNIAYPVFSIHGNHDDPSAFGGVSSLNLLSTSGLVNYFGRCNDLTEIDIRPILMKKGKSQLALYGLSHIHDYQLARRFREKKVSMHKPNESSGEWFNMMVLHQNRADRGTGSVMDLPDGLLDLIVWGHEHDCRIHPEKESGRHSAITQPGSSVATSLSEGEARDKHVGLLRIYGKNFTLDPIKLKTVRPFVFKSINLDDYVDELELDEGDPIPKVREFLKKTIAEMLEKAKEKLNADCPQQPKLPLIRLRVIYTNEDYIFNSIRFGQQYGESVANPGDMLMFKSKKEKANKKRNTIPEGGTNDETELKDFINRYCDDTGLTAGLQLMSGKILSEMADRLAKHENWDGVDKMLEFNKKIACDYLENLNLNNIEEGNIERALEGLRAKNDDIFDEVLTLLDNLNPNKPPTVSTTSIDDVEMEIGVAGTSSNAK